MAILCCSREEAEKALERVHTWMEDARLTLHPEKAFYNLKLATMTRKAFVMSVHPDAVDEYERRHSPIWPELETVLKEHGVSNYSIFLNKDTYQLFAYAEIECEATWEAIARTDVCRRWWAHMGELMPSNPDSSPVSSPLREVFHMP